MSMTILLVDDDPNLLAGLRRALRGENCVIRCSTSTNEAFALMQTVPIQAVVSDQIMEGISGIEFLRQVQRLYPGMIRLLLTGQASAEMVIEAINSGCAERVFMKPCKASQITQAIRELAGHRALLTEAARIIEENQSKRQNKPEPDVTPIGEWSIDAVPCGWNAFMRRLNESTEQATSPGA